MKILPASLLALALAAGSGQSLAQSVQALPYDTQSFDDGHYDYARVLRVVPVTGAPGGYPAYGAGRDPSCTTRDYAGDDYGGGYRDDGYYGSGPQRRGTEGGRTAASLLGSVIGAVIGSQVGGGSARYATAAIGSTVGAVAGRQVYENAQRERDGHVTVCGPYPDRPYAGRAANLYDVTYEYAGRTYTTRTNYDPGNRIRVRVEVHAE
jgi:hypothetical protein